MSAEVFGPSKALVGWLEHASKKDAVEYAIGYAKRSFNAPELSWYDVAPFMGGFLYEIHEGGGQRSHLSSIMKGLAAGDESIWFPVGNRAISVSMRDGKPSCLLLSVADSKKVLQSEAGKISPRTQMRPVVNKGTTVLAIGATLFAVGTTVLMVAAIFTAMSQNFVPSERSIDPSALPHRQWARVQSVPPTLFVESLKLSAGSSEWTTSVKPIPAPGAPLDAAEMPENLADLPSELPSTDPEPLAPQPAADEPDVPQAPPAPIAEPDPLTNSVPLAEPTYPDVP